MGGPLQARLGSSKSGGSLDLGRWYLFLFSEKGRTGACGSQDRSRADILLVA